MIRKARSPARYFTVIMKARSLARYFTVIRKARSLARHFLVCIDEASRRLITVENIQAGTITILNPWFV